MTILEQLAAHAQERCQAYRSQMSLAELKSRVMALPKGAGAFEQALRRPGLSFICECKKASPSKGVIAETFPYLSIAKAYEQAGADAVSVLTEPKWFLGQDAYLQEIVRTVSLPCLRKDFTVDEYMIYQARLWGASAVLLICAILSADQLKEYLALCDALGLSALVEAHDAREIQTALDSGARIIGVNNRDLRDFSVNTDNSRRLRAQVPPEVLFVSESGIQNAEDVERLRRAGVDAVLIGEVLMKAGDKTRKLRELKGKTE